MCAVLGGEGWEDYVSFFCSAVFPVYCEGHPKCLICVVFALGKQELFRSRAIVVITTYPFAFKELPSYSKLQCLYMGLGLRTEIVPSLNLACHSPTLRVDDTVQEKLEGDLDWILAG